LTRQLLAYGRKQILRPEILDLNSVLADMEITLRHLMRRGGEVRLEPAAGLQAVKADAGQIEHVIMNMAMNAADAMTQGGTLTLGTSNVTLDQEYVTRFPELKPGEYVMLSIKDTGTGMSEEIKGRIFEPFFTTKGVGEGTGLGLSTCYGIIKQSGGHVSVQSEVGRGTIFKIYLPPVKQKTTILAQHPDSNEMPRGTETILLVDDDSIWREMSATLLGQLGYRVLEAANGLEALNLQQQSKVTPIDLLITMVGMSNLDGMEFAKRVRQFDPNTRILFTSTSSESTVVHQQILHRGGAYLQKPFTPSRLAHKLREVLDEKTPNNSPHAGHAGGLA
jgi:CheY-like chemotaxis protein